MRVLLCIFCLIAFTQTLNVYSKNDDEGRYFSLPENQAPIDALDSGVQSLEESLIKLNNNLSKINNGKKTR